MSTTQKRNSVSDDVMVRAFGSEPVRLKAKATRGEAIEVVGVDPNVSSFFPATEVYRFDAKLFGLLKAAFDGGDKNELGKLWAKSVKLVAQPERRLAS